MKHPAQMTQEQRQDYRASFAGPHRTLRDVADGLVVYVDNDCPAAMAFAGKAIKPAWNYRFRDEANMEAHIAKWATGHQLHQKLMAERRDQASAPHSLEVGDVMHYQWGYDQTNNDYYQITKLIGARMVEIREIGNDYRENGFMSGTSRPMPGKFIGEPMRKMVNGNRVRIESYATAGKVDPAHATYESHYA